MFSKCLREPFIHFLILGGLLFGLYEFTSSDSTAASESTLKISLEMIQTLEEQWLARNGRDVEESVLDELIENLIREELLVREAKRLGLDQNDVIIHRRLMQKMDFLAANLSSMAVPDDEVLQGYYEANKEAYRVDEKRSFTHIYFSGEKRGANAEADAQAFLDKPLEEKALESRRNVGDNFILTYDYKARSQQQVAQVFGTKFSEKLFALEILNWQGPIVSEYGAHLVYLESIERSYIPEIAGIYKKLVDNYMQEQLVILKDRNYQEMRSRYRIILEN
jgi:peptidyl-prolyl cis-trans isomerase C